MNEFLSRVARCWPNEIAYKTTQQVSGCLNSFHFLLCTLKISAKAIIISMTCISNFKLLQNIYILFQCSTICIRGFEHLFLARQKYDDVPLSTKKK